MEPGGRSRGRGRSSRVEPEPGTSHGRGRGPQICADPSPVSLPDDPTNDDFISAFRRLQTGGVGRGRGRGNAPISVPLPSTSAGSGFQSFRPVDHQMQSTPRLVVGENLPTRVEGTSPGTVSPNCSNDPVAIIKRGEKGRRTSLVANYLRLSVARNMGLYEYHVDFLPDVESRKVKGMLIKTLSAELGQARSFDGAKLYLAKKLANAVSRFPALHPYNQETVTVQIKYVKENSLKDCIHFYNVLLRKIMYKLGMIEMKRNFYDYRAVHQLPAHKLEIYPGYVTAIDEFEGGLMLCCDSSFRVLRTETILEILESFGASNRPIDVIKQEFKNYVVGKIVLTKYNNRNYRIDDVVWDITPLHTFTNKNGDTIQYRDYYRKAHNLEIRSLNQPLLVHMPKPLRNQTVLPVINLIPELCYITGMDSDITSEYTVMRDMALFTKLTPARRDFALREFAKNVNGCQEAKGILSEWGLTLDEACVTLEGRVLTIPQVSLDPNTHFIPDSANFNESVLKNRIYNPVSVNYWQILYSSKDQHIAQKFMDAYRQVTRGFGISVTTGQMFCVGRGSVQDFRQGLERNLNPKVQFVVVIIPSQRDDVYAAIKQVCTVDIPMPSQVILSRTLANDRKFRAIVQKIALQINCKIGGALWVIRVPLREKIMFIGMDVYHDPRRKRPSVTGIVASINQDFTKYYSRVIFQNRHQETVNSMLPILAESLQAFAQENCGFPDRVIVWRDGVGDGQLSFTKEHEVPQVSKALQMLNINAKCTFCVVQKRINARIFAKGSSGCTNPEPGTIVDHTITRKYLYDFFLVSQLVRDGTVTPTHFVVLEDNSSMPPDLVQKFAFATTFMYYNWPGSIRVPAMCQYAHKLASLVGQYTQTEPAGELAKNLYYL